MATVEANTELGQQIVEDAKRYVLYSWSVQDAINPIAVAGGEGATSGITTEALPRLPPAARQRLDRTRAPEDVAAIKEQAEKLCTIGPPMASESRSRLGRLLAEVTPATWRCRSSRTAAPRRTRTRSSSPLVHGPAQGDRALPLLPRGDGGAITPPATRDVARRTRPPGVVRMLDPYTYRCPAGHPDPCPVCTGRRTSRRSSVRGPDTVAAVILETVVGTNGIIVPPTATSSRSGRSATGTASCSSATRMAGFGRTGKWFACENWDVVPTSSRSPRASTRATCRSAR